MFNAQHPLRLSLTSPVRIESEDTSLTWEQYRRSSTARDLNSEVDRYGHNQALGVDVWK